MGMGPIPKKEKFELSVFNRVRNTIQKATVEYFRDPLYYLFYGALAGLIIALAFNASFPWQLYAILGALSIIQLYRYFKPKKKV